MNNQNYPVQNNQPAQPYGQTPPQAQQAPPQYAPQNPQGYQYAPPPPPPGYGAQPQPVVVTVAQKQTIPGKGKATASMVLGIISLVVAIFGSVVSSILYATYIGALVAWIIPIIPFVCGVIGLILGIVARKEMPEGQAGAATAGIVCSAISLVLQILLGIAVLACFGLGALALAGACASAEAGNYY